MLVLKILQTQTFFLIFASSMYSWFLESSYQRCFQTFAQHGFHINLLMLYIVEHMYGEHVAL